MGQDPVACEMREIIRIEEDTDDLESFEREEKRMEQEVSRVCIKSFIKCQLDPINSKNKVLLFFRFYDTRLNIIMIF